MSVKIETVKIIILNNLSVIVLGPNGTRPQGEMERDGRFTRWTILVFMLTTPPYPLTYRMLSYYQFIKFLKRDA